MFSKKGVLKSFTKFTVKHLCQGFFFNKVAGFRLWHRRFPVKFVKFWRTPVYWTYLVAASVNNKQMYQKLGLTLKAPEHEHIFSKYSRNLNILEIFWACYTKNNFPIIFPKCKNLIFWRQSKFKVSRFKSNQFDLKLKVF